MFTDLDQIIKNTFAFVVSFVCFGATTNNIKSPKIIQLNLTNEIHCWW